MKTLKISNDLYVTALPVEIPKTIQIKDEEPSNQYLIFDRSGSMSGYLDNIIDFATDYCKALPEGSTVSVGYFSGSGEYNLSVPYILKKELNGVVSTLDTYRRAIGLTNFIEIMNKVSETAGKLATKSSLFFFTDGCHNSGGSRKDLEKAFTEWKKYAQVTMLVGYGYADRETMSWLASITDGSFVHLDKFVNVRSTLSDFGTAVDDSVPSIKVAIPVSEEIVPISLTGNAIIEYTVENGEISFTPSKKGFKGVFFTTTKPVAGADVVIEADVTMEKGIRALATVHSQHNNADMAVTLLNAIGDKFLIQKLYNAITPDEFSSAEDRIRASVFNTKDRYVEGQVKDFIPAPDAFCVMDAVNILAADENTLMYVRDKDFEYNRIGKKTKQTDGPKVKYPDDSAVTFNDIVMNKERLNLSISTYANGTVTLDPALFEKTSFTKEEVSKLGLAEEFTVSSYKNYAVIADGKLQTKKIVVSGISKSTIKQLGPVISKRDDGKYVVDFSSLPVINKTYVKMTSANELAKNVWAEKVISDEISLLNYYKKKATEATGVVISKDKSISEEAAKFLAEKCYIKNGSYSPPQEVIAADDEYSAYTFSVDIAGYSKVSPGEVVKKLAAGKAPTARESIFAEAYTKYASESSAVNISNVEAIANRIGELQKQLAPIRKNIQLSKMAIILGNRGKMDEFSSREDMSLVVPVQTLSGKDVSVEFKFNIEQVIVKI